MPLYEFLMPGYTLWYLLALVWWRLISVLLPEWILRHKLLLLIVSIAASFFSGFLTRLNLFALPRTLFFLPFFFAGFCLSSKREQLVSTIRQVPMVSSIVVILLIIFINIVVGYNQLPFNTGNVPYYHWKMDLADALLWRFVFSTLCVVVSIAVLRLIPEGNVMISEYGSKSLVLYVYHAILLFSIDLLFRHF
jgi:fucose 4-O-acetylase-like acetyltransferase